MLYDMYLNRGHLTHGFEVKSGHLISGFGMLLEPVNE